MNQINTKPASIYNYITVAKEENTDSIKPKARGRRAK
jgi:hypothetical protein